MPGELRISLGNVQKQVGVWFKAQCVKVVAIIWILNVHHVLKELSPQGSAIGGRTFKRWDLVKVFRSLEECPQRGS